MTLTWDEFRKVDIRVGKVVDAQDFPEARNPSYRLTIDFGETGVKRSSAAIRRFGAVQPDGEVVLLRPDEEKALGARVA